MSSDCPKWPQPDPADKLAHVVLGMADFHRFIFKNAKQHILGHGDIKTWHGRIFEKVAPLSYYAGNYRSAEDPSKPCLKADVDVGQNSGMPFADVPRLMKEYSDELHRLTADTERYIKKGPATLIEKDVAVVQLVAWAVGRFLRIHPFVNGNGRISRLIANYLLYRFDMPFLYPHPYDRPVAVEYATASEACMKDDSRPMYRFILTLLAASAAR